MKQLIAAWIALHTGCVVAYAQADPVLERLSQTPVSILQYGEMRLGNELSSLFEDEWGSVRVSAHELKDLSISFHHHRQKPGNTGESIEFCKVTFDKLKKHLRIRPNGETGMLPSKASDYFLPHNIGITEGVRLAEKIDKIFYVSMSVQYGEGDESGELYCVGPLLGAGLSVNFL